MREDGVRGKDVNVPLLLWYPRRYRAPAAIPVLAATSIERR